MSARVATFWPLSTAAISPLHRATFCRLAAVSPDGTYSLGTNSFDHVFTGSIPGSSAFTGSYPLQVAHVLTLFTAFPHGNHRDLHSFPTRRSSPSSSCTAFRM